MVPQISLLPRFVIVIVTAALAGILIFQESIFKVVSAAANRDDSSHSVFVPLITFYFLWIIKERIKQVPLDYSLSGIFLFLICLIPPLINLGWYQLHFIFFILSICGLVFALLGKSMLKVVAFPILFLISMTPLPVDLYDSIANISRTIAFGGSLKIISLLGIPHLKVGWDIELPNALLRVAISCSGIRYLITFVVFGLAYAYIFKGSTYGRIATVAATIPVSIMASITRLTIIFVMTYWVSPYWAQPRPHIILSWFVFIFYLFLCVIIDQMIQKNRKIGSS